MRYIPTKKKIYFSKWKLKALKFPFYIGIADAPLKNQTYALFLKDIPHGSLIECAECGQSVESTEEFGTPLYCKCGMELGYSHGYEW